MNICRMKCRTRMAIVLLVWALGLTSCYSAPRWETIRTIESVPEDKAISVRPLLKGELVSDSSPYVFVRLKKEIEGPVWVTEDQQRVTETLWHPGWILGGVIGVATTPLCILPWQEKTEKGMEGITCSDWLSGSMKALLGIPPERNRLTRDPTDTRTDQKEAGRSKTVEVPWAHGEITVEINQQHQNQFITDNVGEARIELSKLVAQLDGLPNEVIVLITTKIGEVTRAETIKIPSEITKPIFAARRSLSNATVTQAEVPRETASDVDSPLTRRQRKHSYAVVVGVELYRQKLPKADFADHDAQIIKESLIRLMGYSDENVVLLLNEQAAKSDLEKYLESWLPNHVEKDDSVFIYFSGHGAPNPKSGDAYLVPFDGDPTFIDKTGYSVRRLYEHLGKLPAKNVVVVLDSCFSGAGGRSVIAEGTRPMVLSVESSLAASEKIVVMAASSADQVTNTYKTKKHGLLTYFFMKGLQGEADQNKDGAIDIAELYEYLKPQVERTARREFNNEQTPQLLASPGMLTKGVRLVERPD